MVWAGGGGGRTETRVSVRSVGGPGGLMYGASLPEQMSPHSKSCFGGRGRVRRGSICAGLHGVWQVLNKRSGPNRPTWMEVTTPVMRVEANSKRSVGGEKGKAVRWPNKM